MGVLPASSSSVSASPVLSGQPTVAQPGQSITLTQALALAQSNEATFAAAVAASKVAILERSIARAALLPQASFHNQFLYTQPNGDFTQTGTAAAQAAPRFIANNAVHEYVSQGMVTETLGLMQYTAFARANAAAAIAAAELEVSRRGLTAAVVSLFYGSITGQRKAAIEQRAVGEAADFVRQTQLREQAREAAHADVLKAQLTLQQRQRDLADALVQQLKSRLDLGVLLFADPRSPYTVILPNNPELRSALATVRARTLDIGAARGGYLPDLILNYSYGIDAPQFAANGPDGTRNLGYSASATLDIPIWDWFATSNKIKQAHILRDAAKVAVTALQRKLIVQLDEFYAEAVAARDQLQSLQLTVDTARESLRLTRLRYTAGESTVLEVVDAQNSLTTAELALQDGTVRYQTALANLQLLTGTI
jgi:outer membrane protein